MSKTSLPEKIKAYRCDSCGELSKLKGSCSRCGYEYGTVVQVDRKKYCGLFGHVDGEKKQISRECCTWHFNVKCLRCKSTFKLSETNTFGCLAHGSCN